MNFQIFLRKNNLPPAIIAIELLNGERMIHYDHFSMGKNEIEKTFTIPAFFLKNEPINITVSTLSLFAGVITTYKSTQIRGKIEYLKIG